MQIDIREQLLHEFLDIIEAVHLLIIREEHVSVYLVNEDFVADIFLQGATGLDQVSQSGAWLLVFLLLGVDHVDQRATVLDSSDISWGGLFELSSPWEVLNGKLNVLVIVDLYQGINKEGGSLQKDSVLEVGVRKKVS